MFLKDLNVDDGFTTNLKMNPMMLSVTSRDRFAKKTSDNFKDNFHI